MPPATGWSTRSATIRALNRSLGWQLPTLGPRTLNGLLLEKLETIPTPGTALRIGDYEFEILQIADNAIRTVRVRHAPKPEPAPATVRHGSQPRCSAIADGDGQL